MNTKRAEEVEREIIRLVQTNWPNYPQGISSLLLAESRKEREAWTQKMRRVINDPKLRNSWDYDGLWKCESGNYLVLDEVLAAFDAAILREED